MQRGPSAPASCGLRRRPVRDGSGTMAAGRESETVHPASGRPVGHVRPAELADQPAEHAGTVEERRVDADACRRLEQARQKSSVFGGQGGTRVCLRAAPSLDDAGFASFGEPLDPVGRGLDRDAQRLVDAVGGDAGSVEFVRLAAEFVSFFFCFHGWFLDSAKGDE